jgi:hypothetical protein
MTTSALRWCIFPTGPLHQIPARTEADYEAWRWQRDRTAWNDRMHDLVLPLPTQRPDGIARCFCGEVVTNPTLDSHIRVAHRLIVP